MEQHIRDALGRWLARRLDAASARIVDATNPAGIGYSAETVVLTAEIDHGPKGRGTTSVSPVRARFVLRTESPDPAIYPAQVAGTEVEIDLQRRIMEALAAHSDVPVAAILGAEDDPSVIGAPFFVMEFVDGSVPAVDPPYPVSGFFVDATPEQRRQLVDDAIGILARVHAVDWQAAGLGWLVPDGVKPTARRQLELWEELAERELAGRHHPTMARTFDLLRQELPPGSPPTLCWGDPRLGNMIFSDFRCATVTDWEAACIAPPEVDLGWWLMFDRASHEAAGAPRPPGEPTRAEQRVAYTTTSGRDVGDTLVWECFAALRYAAIVVRVMNRAVARGHVPADHTVWLDNPAVACLDHVLEEYDHH